MSHKLVHGLQAAEANNNDPGPPCNVYDSGQPALLMSLNQASPHPPQWCCSYSIISEQRHLVSNHTKTLNLTKEGRLPPAAGADIRHGY
jgi:hypothetical protein